MTKHLMRRLAELSEDDDEDEDIMDFHGDRYSYYNIPYAVNF